MCDDGVRMAALREHLSTFADERPDVSQGSPRSRVRRDPRRVRAIAFCVSVEHAALMASALTARGIPAELVHGDSPDDV